MTRQVSVEIEDDLFEYLQIFSKTSGMKIKDIAKELIQDIMVAHLDLWSDIPYSYRVKKIVVKYGRYDKSILDDP